MARVKLSPLLASVSGKVGGSVFRSSGKGTELSTAPLARRSQKAGSSEQAQILASDVKSWGMLSLSQRAAWKNVAEAAGLTARKAWITSRNWFRASVGFSKWLKSGSFGVATGSYCACFSPAYHTFHFLYGQYSDVGGLWSADGFHWFAFSTPQKATWTCMRVYAQAGKFVAVASNGTKRVMTSWDGINWQLKDAASASTWRGLDFATDIYQWCAVAESGTYRIMTSSDGNTWTGRSAPTEPVLRSIARSPELGIWVAVGSGVSNQICVSSDGVTWRNYSTSERTSFVSVVWAKELGLFCAASNYGSRVFWRSSDGIHWTGVYAAGAGGVSGLTWSGGLGLFCATFDSGTGRISTSRDAINWTTQPVESSAHFGIPVWSEWHAMFLCISASVPFETATSPLTLEPVKADGTPLLLDYSDKQWTTLTQTPILNLSAPQPEFFTWYVTESSGLSYLSLVMSGELQSGANQTYLEVFVSRPLNAAENNYRGCYKRAGVLWMHSAEFTSEKITWPWDLKLYSGARISFRLRYLSRGCRMSESVIFVSTIN